MTAIYVISDPLNESVGRYKIGSHSGSKEDLITRYITICPQVTIHYFIETSRALDIEYTLKRMYKKMRIINNRGRHSEWYTMNLQDIINAINYIVNAESFVLKCSITGKIIIETISTGVLKKTIKGISQKIDSKEAYENKKVERTHQLRSFLEQRIDYETPQQVDNPQEIIEFLSTKGIVLGDPDTLFPRSLFKIIKQGNQIETKTVSLNEVPIEVIDSMIVYWEKLRDHIEGGIRSKIAQYNELISKGVKVHINHEWETAERIGDEKDLHDATSSLIKQCPHLKPIVGAGKSIVMETDELKIERLKQEVGYYSVSRKPKTRSEIPTSGDYSKWCTLIRLMNKEKKRKTRNNQKISIDETQSIATPNFTMEILVPHSSLPDNQIVSPILKMAPVNSHTLTHDHTMKIVDGQEYNNLIVTPNFVMEILPTTDRSNITEEQVPEDWEAEMTP